MHRMSSVYFLDGGVGHNCWFALCTSCLWWAWLLGTSCLVGRRACGDLASGVFPAALSQESLSYMENTLHSQVEKRKYAMKRKTDRQTDSYKLWHKNKNTDCDTCTMASPVSDHHFILINYFVRNCCPQYGFWRPSLTQLSYLSRLVTGTSIPGLIDTMPLFVFKRIQMYRTTKRLLHLPQLVWKLWSECFDRFAIIRCQGQGSR